MTLDSLTHFSDCDPDSTISLDLTFSFDNADDLNASNSMSISDNMNFLVEYPIDHNLIAYKPSFSIMCSKTGRIIHVPFLDKLPILKQEELTYFPHIFLNAEQWEKTKIENQDVDLFFNSNTREMICLYSASGLQHKPDDEQPVNDATKNLSNHLSLKGIVEGVKNQLDEDSLQMPITKSSGNIVKHITVPCNIFLNGSQNSFFDLLYFDKNFENREKLLRLNHSATDHGNGDHKNSKKKKEKKAKKKKEDEEEDDDDDESQFGMREIALTCLTTMIVLGAFTSLVCCIRQKKIQRKRKRQRDLLLRGL